LDRECSTVPVRDAVVQTERYLRGLIHGHFVFILAPHLGESANPFMNPFIAINLLAATWRRDYGILSNYGVNGLL